MLLPGTTKIGKKLGLHAEGEHFIGVYSGIDVNLYDCIGKKFLEIHVPKIDYEDRIWLEQFHNSYYAKELNAEPDGVISLVFPGFPCLFPVDRICHVVNTTLKYFTTHYPVK